MKSTNPQHHEQFIVPFMHRRRGAIYHFCVLVTLICVLGSIFFPTINAYGNYEDNTTEPDSRNYILITMKTPESTEKNTSTTYEKSCALMSQWTKTHPEIILENSVLRLEDYDSEISYYASQNALPDIFLLEATSVKLWSSWNYLTDLSDMLSSSDLTISRIEPFLVNGRAYTFPALFNAPILIAYDIDAFQSVGCPSFPDTWEDLIWILPEIKNDGYEAVLAMEESELLTHVAPRIFAENCGLSWQERLLSGEEALPYLDKGIPDVLKEIRMITDSETICWDSNPLDSFLENECPAVIITTDDLAALETTEMQVGFALLPVSRSSTFSNEIYPTVTSFMGYALAINKVVAENPDKLSVCVDFCKKISCCDPYEDDLSPQYPDSINTILNSAKLIENPACYNAFTCMNSSLQIWLADDCKYSPREIANAMQNDYEKVS